VLTLQRAVVKYATAEARKYRSEHPQEQDRQQIFESIEFFGDFSEIFGHDLSALVTASLQQ
jgi:hypothetical protein